MASGRSLRDSPVGRRSRSPHDSAQPAEPLQGGLAPSSPFIAPFRPAARHLADHPGTYFANSRPTPRHHPRCRRHHHLRCPSTTGAGQALRKEAAGLIASKTPRFLRSARVKAAAELTEESAKLRTVQAVATLLVGERPPGVELLRKVFEALEHEAATHLRPVVVFIDEVQDLGDAKRWKPEEGMGVQLELERAMRQPGRLVTYAYAGSEETAMEKVFAQGQPLYFESQRYVLPPIDRDAWLRGLRERFESDGRAITADEIGRILGATDGHPLRTMQVCRAALRTARQQALDQISAAVIDEAIAQAKAHPSWREAA